MRSANGRCSAWHVSDNDSAGWARRGNSHNTDADSNDDHRKNDGCAEVLAQVEALHEAHERDIHEFHDLRSALVPVSTMNAAVLECEITALQSKLPDPEVCFMQGRQKR